MFEFRTEGFNGFAVKYSPFFDSKIAVASSANYGLVGNGRLYILNLTTNGIVAEKWSASFPPGLRPISRKTHSPAVKVRYSGLSLRSYLVGSEREPDSRSHRRRVHQTLRSLPRSIPHTIMARAQPRGIRRPLEPGHQRQLLLKLMGWHYQNRTPYHIPHGHLFTSTNSSSGPLIAPPLS